VTDKLEVIPMICDVAKYQGKIDWDKLAPAIEDGYVAIKASGKWANQGDPYYARNVEGAVSHGVPFHAFHFLYCLTVEEAKRDAGLFFRTVQAAGHWPLFWVLDCEGGWGIAAKQARSVAEAFEAELRRLARQDGPGEIRVAVYIGQNVYYDYALDYEHYAYVWIPGYGEKYRPKMPCDVWQYTDKGRLPGISGDVDLDTLIGDKPMEYFTGENGTKEGDTMFTGKQLAAFCEQVYRAGWVYWYGTYGNPCTTSLYNSKKKQYPAHYTADRAAGYKKDIAAGKTCADCVGMIKSFFWKSGDLAAKPVYRANNCPDVSANGMIKLCKQTGPIKTIPDEPGLVVWKDGHIGVYVGGGYTVEMKGFNYDCKRVVAVLECGGKVNSPGGVTAVVVSEVLAVKIYVCGGVCTADLEIVKTCAKLVLVESLGINTAAAEVCTAVVAVLVIPGVGQINRGCALGCVGISAVLDKLPTLV
jgi:GH25 family lysozyme M1 (1,4-beta-N-acetylmuramidase)